MTFESQKSVFQFGNEYACTNFTNETLKTSGVTVSKNGEHIGSIIGIRVPDDIDDEEANVKFDKEVVDWVLDNEAE
jgi:hypothetical protein